MVKKIHDLKEYYEIVSKVWLYFRQYYTDYDAEKALAGVYEFENWVKTKGPRLYEFGMQLIRIVWKEAGELNEIRKRVN